jgi:hypothetical protein
MPRPYLVSRLLSSLMSNNSVQRIGIVWDVSASRSPIMNPNQKESRDKDMALINSFLNTW